MEVQPIIKLVSLDNQTDFTNSSDHLIYPLVVHPISSAFPAIDKGVIHHQLITPFVFTDCSSKSQSDVSHSHTINPINHLEQDKQLRSSIHAKYEPPHLHSTSPPAVHTKDLFMPISSSLPTTVPHNNSTARYHYVHTHHHHHRHHHRHSRSPSTGQIHTSDFPLSAENTTITTDKNKLKNKTDIVGAKNATDLTQTALSPTNLDPIKPSSSPTRPTTNYNISSRLLYVEPSPLIFPLTKVGTIVQRSLRLTNPNPFPISISITCTSSTSSTPPMVDQFHIPCTSFLVNAESFVLLPISFRPTTRGHASCTVRINELTSFSFTDTLFSGIAME